MLKRSVAPIPGRIEDAAGPQVLEFFKDIKKRGEIADRDGDPVVYIDNGIDPTVTRIILEAINAGKAIEYRTLSK